MMTKKKDRNLNLWFGIALIAGELIYWGIMVLTRSSLLHSYFFYDVMDTGMDYFNSLATLSTLRPYDTNASYPAMCYLIWRVLYHLIPADFISASGKYMRDLQFAQLGYILCTMVALLSIWEIIKQMLGSDKTVKYVITLGILFSGPFLYTLERGNIFLLAVLFLLIFVYCYDSEKKWVRWAGYFALAFSASIKMYPALFGILVISKKRYKEAAGLIVIGVVMFAAPFFAFDGITSITDMIRGLTLSGTILSNLGTGYNFSFTNLVKIAASFRGVVLESVPGVLHLIPVLVCCLIYVLNREEWKKMTAIVLLCIWLPEYSYTYTLLLLVVPMLVFLMDERYAANVWGYVYRILFLIILLPLALPVMNALNFEGAERLLSWPVFIVNIVLVVLGLLLLCGGIYHFAEQHRRKTEPATVIVDTELM